MNQPTPTARLLQALVRIPSVNPEGSPGVDQTGELACARWVAAFLRKSGAKVQLPEIEPGRPNVIGVFKGSKPTRRRILLAPHTDTVSVAGMTIDPFSGKISQGRLWGRGASDTKGTMAAMLQAVHEFTKTADFEKNGLEITFAGLMGEEAGNAGARHLARNGKAYDLAIIGEPTDFKIVHAHNGVLWLSIETTGKARHASIAGAEHNAIYKMQPVIEYFRNLQDSLPDSPGQGFRSICVSTMQAGSKTNISPAHCRLEVDIRTSPQSNMRGMEKSLHAALKMAAPHARLKVEGSSPPLNTSTNNPLLQLILPATRGLAEAPWFCDAALFAETGTPSIALGPGSIRQAHTANEYIRLSDLEKGRKCYLAVLKILAGD